MTHILVIFFMILGLLLSGCESHNTTSTQLSGELDTDFGIGGIVTDNNASGGNGTDNGESIIVVNNSIYVAGYSSNAETSPSWDMALWAYNLDGSLNQNFGTNGIVTDNNASGGNGNDIANSLALAHSKLYVVGYSDSDVSTSLNLDMALWSYDLNGSLDANFGTNGIVTDNNASGGNRNDIGKSIFVTETKIYVAGSSTNSASKTDMTLWAYDLHGSLDPNFGTNGIVTDNNASGGNGNDLGYALTIVNNKIYVAGESQGVNFRNMTLWSYNLDGSVNTDFGGGNGVVTYNNANGDSFARAIAIKNNKIYLSGGSHNGVNVDLAIWRFNIDGTLDTNYGEDNGVTLFDSAGNGDIGNSIVIDDNENAIVSGTYSITSSVVVMFDSNGKVASDNFATNGFYLDTNAVAYGSTFNNDKSKLYVTGHKIQTNIDMSIWSFK
ncbi:MAG: hypothetical protein JXQ67_00620 [Campylobacterales bacterium]|nr:hypothetical protein [Campylobacterales bacterium]